MLQNTLYIVYAIYRTNNTDTIKIIEVTKEIMSAQLEANYERCFWNAQNLNEEIESKILKLKLNVFIIFYP